MEEFVVKFGFGLVCLFFLFALCIDLQFIWGAFIGVALTLFGWYFWEE